MRQVGLLKGVLIVLFFVVPFAAFISWGADEIVASGIKPAEVCGGFCSIVFFGFLFWGMIFGERRPPGSGPEIVTFWDMTTGKIETKLKVK